MDEHPDCGRDKGIEVLQVEELVLRERFTPQQGPVTGGAVLHRFRGHDRSDHGGKHTKHAGGFLHFSNTPALT